MITIAFSTTLYVLRTVFSYRHYTALAIATASGFWVIFNVLDGLLFFSPIVSFYYPLPEDSVPGFIISNITAALVGIVIAMNVYIFRNYKARRLGKSFFSGSALGTFSSMCASCSSVGFFIATLFGSAGIAASSFLSTYQFPLRIVAVGLLLWAYYSAQRRITSSCMINR